MCGKSKIHFTTLRALTTKSISCIFIIAAMATKIFIKKLQDILFFNILSNYVLIDTPHL